MERNQELTLSSTGEYQAKNQKLLEVTPTQSPIATKLAEVRVSAQTHLQNFRSLLEGRKTESVSGVGEKRDARLLLEELAKSEGLGPSEYLQRSQRALNASSNLWRQIKGEIGALESFIRQKEEEELQIDGRLRELEEARGLKRILATFKRRSLTTRKADIQLKINTISSQVHAKRDQLEQLQEHEKLIKQKQEELILAEMIRAVQAVKAEYEGLLQEVIKDVTITKEIRNAYIQRVIAPKVEKIMKEKKLPKSRRDEFYQSLDDCIDHRNSSDEERRTSEEKLDRFLTYEAEFWEVRDDCRALISGGDERIVWWLVAVMAAEDIAPIRAVAEPYYNKGEESSCKFLDAFIEAIEPTNLWGLSSFGSQILSVILRPGSCPYSYLDVSFWQAVKYSPTAIQAFGEIIRKQDQEFYQMVLGRSLSDQFGDYIDLLRFYPTPDSIRNLVLLVSDYRRKYRTIHANQSLTALAKRPDWGQILDEAEEKYPSLKNLRLVLQSWDYGKFSNHPDIREMVGEFALDIFRRKPADQQLLDLVVESLSNSCMLTILAERGVLSEKEMTTIKNADTFLKEIPQEIQKRHREGDYSMPYISGDSFRAFRDGLRETLLALVAQEPSVIEEQRMVIMKRFVSLSQAILENKTIYPVLDYLTERSVVNRIKDPSFKTETLPNFLEAYKTCPALLTNKNFLREFCRQFEGEQTVVFFRDMSVAYQNQEEQLNQIITLVGMGALTKERALELPTKAPAMLSSPQFSIAIKFPQLFLETDDGLEFFNQINTSSLFSLDKRFDARIGERIQSLQREGKLRFSELLIEIAPPEIEQLDRLLASGTPIDVNQQNWQQLLIGYVISQAEIYGLPKLSQVSIDRIKDLFNNPKIRGACLSGLRNSWLAYLKSGKPGEFPFSLNFVSEFINYCGGAGPLSQVESLNSLISSVNWAFSRKTTVERTKLEISQGIVRIEERFAKERWSNKDRTDFYNISRDILSAAPSLFSDYLALFEKLSPSQMRSFARDIYPLHRTRLVLMEKKDERDYLTYDKRQLVHIRTDIRNFAEIFNAGENSFDKQKQQLLEEIRGIFKDRFGIIKVPQKFSSEHMMSLTNVSKYLANLHHRTEDDETVLGFYLSMMFNDRWDAFRRGEAIDPREYLTPEKSAVISRLLQERQRLNPMTPERLGLSEEVMPEFLKILQQETQNTVVGNIETIDIKLTNIILNLRGLEDLDLYPDPLDKQRMRLLLDWGNKKVGSVVARMYQSLATPGKAIQFSEEDTRIQQQITQAIQQLGLSLTPQTLKEHFQDGIKPLVTVVNLLNFIRDTRAESEIESLRDLLKPSEDVIRIFRRLGEDFKPTSGAMALSQDLNYLDNLIIKREDELTPEEKKLLTEYTASIREQMVKLEGIYGQIKNKFRGFKQGIAGQKNPLLQDKLDQIDKAVNAQTTQQAITSTVTNNLNTIIENIRECLSCTREGINNDTNLTFGDMNKFYLFSQSETQQRGSISDQIVFVEPVTRADGSQVMAFVLDRIYGTNTPTILENQVEAVLKKYRAIKQRFPNIRLSIFVSDAAASSGGTSLDMMQERFKQKNINAEIELVEVDVAESAMGHHYIEFGGPARAAGKRKVNGIIITL